MNHKNPIEKLTNHLCRIPGVGKRSAERYAYSILDWEDNNLQDFANLLSNLKEVIKFCETCGALLHEDKCIYCENTLRDNSTICVVEHFTQINIIEKSGSYKGLYHVLGGRLKPLENIGPDQLRIDQLISRLSNNEVQEVILALNLDIEGEATAIYITNEITPFELTVTRLASGIPAGANLNYTDAATMALAISRRQNI